MKALIFLMLFIPICIGHALCEECEWQLTDGFIYSIAREAVTQAACQGLSSPYRYHHSDWIRSFVEDCTDYSVYREKFDHLIWYAEYDINIKIANLRKDIRELEARIGKITSQNSDDANLLKGHLYTLGQIKTVLTAELKAIPEIQTTLNQGLTKITSACQKLYSLCISKHDDQSYYERSLIYFDQGKAIECVNDISRFLESGKKLPTSTENSQDPNLILGSELSDLGLYLDAIESLTKAIQRDPENKDAFLERAVAYFEIGSFENSIKDFISSGCQSKPLHSSFYDYATGFIWGASNGFIEAIDQSVPSILGSVKGLGNAIWSLSTSPQRFSSEFVNACNECLKFLKQHSAPEIIEAVSPELRKLVFEYDTLSDLKRGELAGKIICKNGIEIFATTGALKAYRELRRANMVATLETFAISRAEGKIFEHAEKWGASHAEILGKIKADDVFIKSLKTQNLTELTIRKTLHELGYKTFPRPKGLPGNFRATFSDKKCGMKYIDPTNEHSYVRIMPGNPVSKNPWQQKPYVNEIRNGQCLDKYGNPTSRESQTAHIPIEEFVYRQKK